MDEPLSNITGIHAECADERHKRFQVKYTVEDVRVGDWVKKNFSGEHIWVKVEKIDGQKISGKVDNDVVTDCGVRCGDAVELEFSEVEEICWRDD